MNRLGLGVGADLQRLIVVHLRFAVLSARALGFGIEFQAQYVFGAALVAMTHDGAGRQAVLLGAHVHFCALLNGFRRFHTHARLRQVDGADVHDPAVSGAVLPINLQHAVE